MKKLFTTLFAGLMVATLSLGLAACKQTPDEPSEPIAESISVSGQKTQFYTGDAFSTGEMVVTITYDDDSTKAATADEYSVDSSAYVSTTAGDYTIVVSLNDTTVSTTYTVNVEDRTYSVFADSGVSITSGVTNGTTKVGQTIAFTAEATVGKHIVAVKVNGTALTAVEGVYSFETDTYLENADSSIVISVEQEDHDYTSQVTAPTCDNKGYTTYTCACGDSYEDDKTETLSLLGDLTKWTTQDNPLTLEAVNGGVKVTQSRADTWGFNWRNVTIDTDTDKYLVVDFDGLTVGATFQVQFSDTGDEYKKGFGENGRHVLSMSDLGVSASGEQVLNIYILGNQGASVVVRELSFVSAEDASIHTFGTASTTEGDCHTSGVSVKTCTACGATTTSITESARFLYAGGAWGFGEGLTMSYANHVATLTVAADKTWGGSWRTVNMKTTDYLRFAGTGKFKVEIKAPGANEGTLLISMQEMNGVPMVVALNEIVTTDGEYTILIYAEGTSGSTHTITECFILSSADENVHTYGEWNEDGDSRTHACSVCGASETQTKVAVTFDKANSEENAVVKVYPGEKVSALETAPTKQGYTFSKWQKNGADFDFATQITEAITLTAVYTANTDTAYKVEIYEQNTEGAYVLKDTKNLTGTTATDAAFDENSYIASSEHLYLDKGHEGYKPDGNIAADGTLVLKVYYSYKQVAVYSLDGLDCASIKVTFDAVDDEKMALLELRDASNEQVGKVYASVASNVATFDVSAYDLADKYAVITVGGVSPTITSVVTVDNVVASANVFELLATKGPGTYNGIALIGPGTAATQWVDGYGFSANTNGTIAYKGEGGFDRGVVTVSVLSFCGSGGNDKIFIKDGSDKDVGSLAKDAYGVVASKDISFTADATTLKFIAYLYCAGANGWAGCPGDPETIAAHGQEWCRIDKVVYYKEFTLESTKLLAINGKEAEYIAPTEIVRYESEFYGDLRSINVAVPSETSAQINIYENGIQIGGTLSAEVNSGVAKFDVTSLKLANTTIQIEVLGDATVSNINLDTTDYINVGKALYNGCTDYHGGMAFKSTADWMQMDAEGKFRAGKWYGNGSKLLVFDFANIKDNLVKFDFVGKCYSVCDDGGNERMFLIGINNGNNETICGPQNGSADSTENVKTLSLEKSKLGSKTTCDVTIQLGCNNSNADTKAEHLAKEYLTLEITATLSYAATAMTIYR